jgi:tetratricopeptide (TPR) repeat protein
LQVLLREQYPERRIEIINTAVTAINSHVIRPIAREAAEQAGDAWVIYLGNNEVVGPFGSGTVFGAQTPPLPVIRATVALKATRTGQLMDDLLQRTSRRAGPREWDGMEMFLQQQIRQTDLRMARVYGHFRQNLADIVAFGVGSGAKVVLSTVGSNVRDCAPLASLHREDLPADKVAAWEAAYQAGVALEQDGKPAEAVVQYQRAAQVDGQFAELHYRLGRCKAALGRGEAAQKHFILARDLDTLRFRADSRINEIIRQVAAEWQPRGVRLADTEAVLARASADGIPGAEWFHEHVHLTFAGNYQTAWAMAEQIAQALAPVTQVATAGAKPLLSLDECARRLGSTDCERLRMAQEVTRRTSRPPFTQQLDHATEAPRRAALLAELQERDRTNFAASVASYRQALAQAGDDWQIHDNFAGALVLHGDESNAVVHLRRVAQLLPHFVQTYHLLGSILIEQNQFADAEACYAQALNLERDHLESRIGLGRVRLAQNRGKEAVEEFRRAVKLQPRAARTHNHLGVALLQLDRAAEAEAAFRAALQAQPEFLPARLNLGSALVALGKADEAIAGYQELLRTNPANTAARIKLGRTLAQQGSAEEAIVQYAEAVRQQPDDFEARSALGGVLIKAQRFAEAVEQFSAAVRLKPDDFEARINFGSLLAGQGKTTDARKQFEEALRIRPGVAAAHLNLALVLMEENRPAEADAQLREALRLEPGNVRARQALNTALAR